MPPTELPPPCGLGLGHSPLEQLLEHPLDIIAPMGLESLGR